MKNNIVSNKAIVSGKRSVRSENVSNVGTFKHGKIIPLYFKEILPGETFSPSDGFNIRMNPLTTPIFDDIFFDQYWFFVPYRLIWNESKQFFGENDSTAWTQTKDLIMPQTDTKVFTACVNKPQSLFDYIYGSVAAPSQHIVPDLPVNALPLRAYIEIYNNWFRNQNITAPVLYSKQSDPDGTLYLAQDLKYDDEPLTATRFHDIASTLLPEQVKGDVVKIGLGTSAPLAVLPSADTYNIQSLSGTAEAIRFGRPSTDQQMYPLYVGAYDSSAGGSNYLLGVDGDSQQVSSGYRLNTNNSSTNLVADLTNVTAVSISDLVYAEALQRYRYLLGIGGSRYQEYIHTMYDVTPSAAVLDYPEYLAGARTKLNINQVVSHGESSIDGVVSPLGDVAGISWTNDAKRGLFSKTFMEHGILMCVGLCRHPTTYAQKIHPFAFKSDLLDIYVKTFANIYDLPFDRDFIWPYRKSVLGGSDNEDPTKKYYLGFAEPWWDYKHELNKTCGYMNVSFDSSLKTYSLATVYDSKPTLSDEFIFESRESILRVTAGDFDFDYMFSLTIQYTDALRIPALSDPGDIIGKLVM